VSIPYKFVGFFAVYFFFFVPCQFIGSLIKKINRIRGTFPPGQNDKGILRNTCRKASSQNLQRNDPIDQNTSCRLYPSFGNYSVSFMSWTSIDDVLLSTYLVFD
jgi:hypothetical protein